MAGTDERDVCVLDLMMSPPYGQAGNDALMSALAGGHRDICISLRVLSFNTGLNQPHPCVVEASLDLSPLLNDATSDDDKYQISTGVYQLLHSYFSWLVNSAGPTGALSD